MALNRVEHELRYGRRHRQLRRELAGVVAAGRAKCARCARPILPTEQWDLSHVDGGGPADYEGVAHARCNRATATHRVEREQRRTSRDW
jgi:hypothetical protein